MLTHVDAGVACSLAQAGDGFVLGGAVAFHEHPCGKGDDLARAQCVSDEGDAGESDEPAAAPAPSPGATTAATADDDDNAVPLAAGALVFSAVAAALSAYTLYLVRQLARRSPST